MTCLMSPTSLLSRLAVAVQGLYALIHKPRLETQHKGTHHVHEQIVMK